MLAGRTVWPRSIRIWCKFGAAFGGSGGGHGEESPAESVPLPRRGGRALDSIWGTSRLAGAYGGMCPVDFNLLIVLPLPMEL